MRSRISGFFAQMRRFVFTSPERFIGCFAWCLCFTLLPAVLFYVLGADTLFSMGYGVVWKIYDGDMMFNEMSEALSCGVLHQFSLFSDNMGIFFALLGIFCAFDTVGYFDNGPKGELMLSLPVGRTQTFLAVALSELLRGAGCILVSLLITLLSEVLFAEATSPFSSVCSLLAVYLLYFILYFAVGTLAALLAEKRAHRIALCTAYWLGCYTLSVSASEFLSRLPVSFNGVLSLIIYPFGANAPMGRVFTEAFWKLRAEPFVFTAVQYFGMILSALLLLVLCVLVINRGGRSYSGGFAYSFMDIAVKAVITNQLYFICFFVSDFSLGYNNSEGGLRVGSLDLSWLFSAAVMAALFLAVTVAINGIGRKMLDGAFILPLYITVNMLVLNIVF